MPSRPILHRRLLSIAATSLLLLCTAAPGHAQSAEAEALFGDADKLMAEGKIAAACDAFDASNRIEPRAGTLIRLGECRELNHQLASAWSAFKDALTRVRDPRKRERARARLAALEPRLSYLTVLVSDEARVDGLALSRNGRPLDAALWNRAVPVDGGAYVIGGRAPGHEEWSTTVVVPDDGGRVSVEVPKFKEILKLVTPAETPPQPPSATPSAAGDRPRPGSPARPGARLTTRRWIALGAAGAGVIALGTGALLGIQSGARHDEAAALCPDPATPCADAGRANALSHTARSRALAADLGFGVAAAAAITAAVLWLSGAPESAGPRPLAIAPAVAAHQTSLVMTGSF